MTIYRTIYEKYFGPIPLDEEGRTYEIHHKDGNRQNNQPSNLQALSIREHFDIHYKQGDYNACLAISMRMKKDIVDIRKLQSEIGRKSALKRLEEGTHNFLGKSYRLGTKHTEETKKKIREKRALQIMPERPDLSNLFSKKWIVTFPNGQKEKVINLKLFCKENSLFYSTMCKIGNGKLKSHRGFSCEKTGE